MEDPMFKQLSICAALLVITAGSANAQQEAVLERMEVPGAAFDIILAMPKPKGAIFDLSESPDALVMHLIGGERALGFDVRRRCSQHSIPCGCRCALFMWRARIEEHGSLFPSTSFQRARNSPQQRSKPAQHPTRPAVPATG
jgi:hypothetical protein